MGGYGIENGGLHGYRKRMTKKQKWRNDMGNMLKKWKKSGAMILVAACILGCPASGSKAEAKAKAKVCSHHYIVHSSWGATCTASGGTKCICTKCKKITTTEKKPLGHQYSTRTVKKATCTADGLKEKYCLRCGKVVSRTAIYAKGHTYSARKATKRERIRYGWGTVLTCKKCGYQKGSYADY